jgi:hypothetical protein
MKMLDLLMSFCAKDSSAQRTYLHKPFRLGEFIYATNGHVAIRIPDDGTIQAEDIEKVKSIGNYFSDVNGKYVAIPELPAAESCSHCYGTGKGKPKTECDECDGDGEFRHGSHYYECKECDGEGSIEADEGVGENCEYCNGTGEQRHQPIKVGKSYFNRMYLVKISTLPNLKFCNPKSENDFCNFIFDGGEGCIMPIRM